MSDFHKHFLQHIFQRFFDDDGVESGNMDGKHFDIEAFGEKIERAKSANIDAMNFLERCHEHDGKSVEDCLKAFDDVVAKLPPTK
jgi:hypothetical protein